MNSARLAGIQAVLQLSRVTHEAVDTQAELQALVTYVISNLTGPVIIIDDRLADPMPLPAMMDEPVPIPNSLNFDWHRINPAVFLA